MKNIYGLLLSLIILNSCNNQSKIEKISSENTINRNRILSQSEREYYNKYDFLESDSIRIEGKIKLLDLRVNMENVFGKPTKIERSEYCVSFFYEDTPTRAFYHYGDTGFESYKDSIALCKIDFRSTNKQFVCPQIKLNQDTKLEDLRLIFPKSFRQQYKLDGETTSNERIVVPILVCKNCDDKFFLIFENGKLIQIENHMDC
jgi:hypothetical protein